MSLPFAAQGEFALVKQHLEEALTRPSTVTPHGATAHEHDVYAMLADVATQQRDEVMLHNYAPLAEATATRYDHKLYQGIAHRAWGALHQLTGDYAASETRLRQALDLFSQLDTRWQIGRTLSELGELAAARVDRTLAHDYYARALNNFEAMKAVPDAGRTHIALGIICRDGNDLQAAREHFEKAAAQFETSKLTEELERTRELMAGVK